MVPVMKATVAANANWNSWNDDWNLNANDLDAATKIIEGSARAMGLEVVEG